MSKKKIHFSKKPSSIENSPEIDEWVRSRNIDSHTIQATNDTNLLTRQNTVQTINEKRFTIVMPEDLYRKLKIKCAKNDLKLKDFIINSLEKNLID